MPPRPRAIAPPSCWRIPRSGSARYERTSSTALPDVFATLQLTVGQPYHRALHLRRNLVFEFTEAGHTLGSASIELRTGEGGSHRIVYTGSVGRPGSGLFRDAAPIPGEVDTLIIGSPFAHLRHPTFSDARQRIADHHQRERGARRTDHRPRRHARPGPGVRARSAGPLQRNGNIPGDSDLDGYANPGCAAHHAAAASRDALAGNEHAYAPTPAHSTSSLLHNVPQGQPDFVDTIEGPAIIVAPNETCDAGRSAHHLQRCLGDDRHTIVFISFQEEGSVGRLLQDGAESVEFRGATIQRKATIETMTAYSGFADGEEMRGWIRALGGPVKRAFVVQGDDLAVAMMVTILREEGVRDVIVPRQGESFPF